MAVREYLPNVEHRNCCRHLCTNFRGRQFLSSTSLCHFTYFIIVGTYFLLCPRFKANHLRDLFWVISCATNKVAYERGMKAMERASKPAYQYLQRKDPKTWCKAFFDTHSCTDNVENNMSESFNAWIINERYNISLNCSL